MPDSAEQLIVNRLAAAPSIHPSGANLFVQDWTLEPGDIVTVLSGEESYQVPIYSMNLKWNGTSMLDIQSTGNQKRNPLSALNEKKTNEFRSGRRGLAIQQEAEEAGRQQYEHYTEQTDAYRTEIYRVNGVRYDGDGNIIYQTDPETGEYILDGAGNKIPVYDESSDGSISGQVIQSAQRMATIIKQSGTVLEVFDKTHQYYEGDRVLYPDSNGNVYRFITDHDPGDWKGTGEHGDVEAVGTLQSQIDNNTENFNIFYGEVDDRLGTIEGSTLWGNASELLAINGRIRVDSQTGRLIIEEGGGLYTERTTEGGTKVYSGIWDDGNITAGTIVQKINGTTETTISADKVNLEGYVKADYVDAAVLLASSLTSTNGYIGQIKASNINTGGNINADGAVYGTGIYIKSTSQSESGETVTSYTDVSDAVSVIHKKTTGLADGEIGFEYRTLGSSTWIPVNFNIADTAKYKADVGISTILSGGWTNDGEGGGYYNTVTATANDSTEANPDTADVNVVLPNITVKPDLGTRASGTVKAFGPEIDGEAYQVSTTNSTLYLQVDDDHCYITTNQSTPTSSGQNANIVAQIDNPGSGTAYSQGYAKGQENANAAMSGVALNLAKTSYSADSNNLTIQVLARPKLELFSEDDPPIKTEVLGENEAFDKTMDVAVTNVTISDSSIVYNQNGTYTIGGTGGKVNIGAADGQGGANIPVDTNAHTFTPTEALNAVNVVKGSWTGTTTKTIEFTTDAPNPVSGSSKSVSLTLNKGGWTWEAEDGGGGNYKTQVQVKDGSAGILTDYVTMPDLSVDVDKPQQQDSWWNTSGTYAYQYVVPQIGAVPYLSSDTSKQNPLGYYHNDGTIVINPSQAIEHGKSLVSVTRTWTEYDGTPSGDTTLEGGKTYHLEVKKDSATVYDELYTVPEQAAPTVNTWGLAYQTGTDYTYKASVNVNGTQYESGNLNATEAYNNGWTGAYQSVGIFPTAVADLVPGGSPITIYAQAKANSGSAKSNVASVQVKARALNLKDETFTANDTYAVPEGYDGYGAVTVNVQGGGGSSDRRAVFLDNITLTAPTNPEPGFNWQFTESSFAHYTDPVSVETDAAKKTQVTIDASAIYQAGLAAGGSGDTVDVVKGDWELSIRPPNIGNLCTFRPSTGTGETASVLLRSVPQTKSKDNATATANVSITDYGQGIFSVVSYLVKGSNDYAGYVYLTTSQGSVTDSNILAKIPIDSVPGADTRYISTLSPIKLTPSDISTSTKETTATFDIGDNQTNVPISIDASDVYNKGLTDGSGLKIENEKTVTASQNNTTITVLPTYTASEQYDVMGSVKVNVRVQTHEGISSASIIDQSETEKITWQKELGTKTLSSQYGQIEVTGNDGSTKRLVVDAHQVYQNGMNAGAGIQIKDEERKEVNTVQTNITITPTSVNGVNYEAMRKAIVYVNLPRIKDTEDVGDITVGSSSTTLNVTPTGGYGAMKKVTGTIKATYATPTISCSNWSGGSPTASKTITVANNSTGFITVSASANGKTSPAYIIVIKHS